MAYARRNLIIHVVLILTGTAALLRPASAVRAASPIAINEFLPASSTSSEWTEIINNGDAEIDLSNWKIDDDTVGGTRTTIPSGTRIPGHSLLVIANTSTIFNDTGADAVQLSDAAGNLIDSATYSNATKEMSYARIPDGTGAFVKGTPSQGTWNVAAPTNTPIPTETSTPSATPASTSTATPTFTPTSMPTSTATSTPTHTPSAIPIETAVPTNTATPIYTPSATPTDTAVPTGTPSATPLNTIVLTSTPTNTAISFNTTTPTYTPGPTATSTPSPTPTYTPGPTATNTPSPTATNTSTATPTQTPTNTVMPIFTSIPSQTSISTPSATNTPTATATPTNTPSATITATPYPAGIIISEFLANPKILYTHEWFELYNAADTSADVSGWKVDDAEGGSAPVTIAAGTIIPPHGYLVINLPSTILNNDGDSARLLRPNGTVADATTYTSSQIDLSWSRAPDGNWYLSSANTPGELNALPATPTMTPTANPLPSTEPLETSQAVAPSPTPTNTPTASPTAVPEGIQINEFLPYPKQSYSAEWIELYNRAEVSAYIGGWKLDDGEGGGAPFTLPSSTAIDAHGYLVITLPSSLLNNDGDSVRLLRPDGTVADEVIYTNSQPDISYSRAANGDWYLSGTNTPGELNASPAQPTANPSTTPSSTPTFTRTPSPTRTTTPTRTATATASATPSPTAAVWPDGILLSEALANPRAAYDAEWAELYNSRREIADLSGWQIDDGEGGGKPYLLPPGTVMQPGEYLVITLPGTLLNNGGDTLRLLRPDGSVADLVILPSTPADTSYSRAADGSWHISNSPSPAAPNNVLATESAETPIPAAQIAAQLPVTTKPPHLQIAENLYDVVLSEALPNPRVRYPNEWVELINRGDGPADIGGWSIDDGPGGGSPFKLPVETQISAHGLLLVQLPKALLNNGGDTLRLLRPDGSIADEYRFGATKPDMSVCRVGGEWVEGCEPSPGQPNSRATIPANATPASTIAPDSFVASASGSQLPGQANEARDASPPTSLSTAGKAHRSLARIPAQFLNHPAAQPYALTAKGQRYTGQIGPMIAVPSPTPRTRPSLVTQPAPTTPGLPTVPIGFSLLALAAGWYTWGSRRAVREGNPPDDMPNDE